MYYLIEFDEVLMREVHAGKQADSKKPVLVHALSLDSGKANMLFIEGTLLVTHAANIRYIRRTASSSWLPSWLTQSDDLDQTLMKQIGNALGGGATKSTDSAQKGTKS